MLAQQQEELEEQQRPQREQLQERYTSTYSHSSTLFTCTLSPLHESPSPISEIYAYKYGEVVAFSEDGRGLGERMKGVIERLGGTDYMVEFEEEEGMFDNSIGVRIYKLCVTLTKDVISSYLFDSNLSLAGNSVSSLQSFSVGSESLRKKVMG
eukprot:CAMPEP_0182494040 /NCGR_PEP_ID=MMETSP1321-20130603/2931_1 /TAXON_ID=91990 /ORGANISM="Bolidomonas sp., Strain RCC1657" /LENGTH=152 /DNA_ID=CAMNT_0024696985 /DNA_START=177 /DNA_END=632 /DNA_ORIENTATION=+